MDFDRWLQRFVSKVEKILFRGALLFIVLLFIVQALMTEENIRHYFSRTDQLEGMPLQENVQEVFGGVVSEKEYADETESEYRLLIEVSRTSGPGQELFVLCNGKVAGELGNEPLDLPVKPGDMLEIIGTVTGGTPAVVRIKEVHGDLSSPSPGDEIVTFGERELLGWILP